MTSPRTRRSPRVGPVRLGIALLALLAPHLAPAQNPYKLKPGAKGAVCLECHETFQDTMKLPHVHTPVKSGDCSSCHDPHASSHGKLLAEEPSRICLECHEGVAGEAPRSAHGPVVEGSCSSCHDPHASEHANNLVRPGNELCNGCHADVASSVAAARFGHAPVRDDCLSCHDPHSSSAADFLLAKAEPDLCMECHDTSGSAFRDRHMMYPVERGRCTSCHSPHGSSQGAILWANVHRPVVNRMCGQCHGDPSATDALTTVRAGFDLCQGCHNDTVNRTFASARLHWPVADREACLNCHSPHASAVPALLTEPMTPLCGNCHADVVARGERSLVKHEPVAQGDCVACHDPHGSDNLFLFDTESTIELCGGCHDWSGHTSHPIGEDVVDPRSSSLLVDCTSCHRSHGTPHEHLAHLDTDRELCVDCHAAYRR